MSAQLTDRELLEFAAKAAGYEVRWHERWECFVHVGPYNTDNPPTLSGQRHVWIPFNDDGDSFRLAMDLELGVVCKRESDPYERYRSVVTDPYRVNQIRIVERHNGDPKAATRRAVVRAAAEIGKAMP